MERNVTCPKCGNTNHLLLVSTHRGYCSAIGGSIGCVVGYMTNGQLLKTGLAIGFKLGAAVPGIGPKLIIAAINLTGAVTGFFKGVTAGIKTGELIDKKLVLKYRCTRCGSIFNPKSRKRK